MSEKKKPPRWVVWLWTIAMEAATGAMVVMGVAFILALGAIWILGIVQGPPPVRWVLLTLVLLTGLVLIGRWFDRREQRGIPAPPFSQEPPLGLGRPSPYYNASPTASSPTVGAMARLRRNRDPNLCGSIRPIWGSPGVLLECELTIQHLLDDSEHQASRPNGRYLWGNGGDGESGAPRWVPDNHWTGDDRLPPKEPFSWSDHRQATRQHAEIERTDPREPQS